MTQVRLQRDLDYLLEWEVKWDVEFNPPKCLVIHITRARNPIKNKYMMHGQIFDSVDYARYLDVDIADDFNFSQQVNRITSNAMKSLGYLKRNIKPNHSAVTVQPRVIGTADSRCSTKLSTDL